MEFFVEMIIMKEKKIIKVLILSLLLCFFVSTGIGQTKNVLLQAITDEMNRSFKVLKEKGDPPPYFLSFRVTDTKSTVISAAHGALLGNSTKHSRILDTKFAGRRL